jgi:hypothetical protein
MAQRRLNSSLNGSTQKEAISQEHAPNKTSWVTAKNKKRRAIMPSRSTKNQQIAET